MQWQVKSDKFQLNLGKLHGLAGHGSQGMATHSSILAWRIAMDREACQATIHEVSQS